MPKSSSPLLKKIPNLEPIKKTNNPTPLTNDPMEHFKNTKVVGLCGLIYTQRTYKVQLDYSTYLDTTENEYNQLVAINPIFGSRVSLSMYTYYAAVMLFAKQVYHLSDTNRDLNDWNVSLKQILPHELALPPAMRVYLSCLGKVLDSSGREWMLDIPLYSAKRIASIKGWFGEVNEENFITYQTSLSPAVCLMRVAYDYAKTSFATIPHVWNIPAGIRCTTPDSLPNTNLLGWRKARTLEPLCIQALTLGGIELTYNAGHTAVNSVVFDDSYNIGNVTIWQTLINYVNDMLIETNIPQINAIWPTSPVGSQSILGYVINTVVPAKEQLVNFRSSESVSRGFAYCNMIPNRANMIAISRFRRKRAASSGDYCYTFTNNKTKLSSFLEPAFIKVMFLFK